MALRNLLNKDGSKVEVGDKVTSFRGEEYYVTGWPINGHNRVYVTKVGEKDPDGSSEFFPSVFDMKWEDEVTK